MKILFTFYIPSGGVETLNWERHAVLSKRGVECHFHYRWPGTANHSGMPVFVTDHDAEIKAILDQHRYDAVIVTSHYEMLERIRRLGYTKPVIFECQGLGTIEQATGTLLEALPYIYTCSNAVLYPRTKHMIQLFEALYPGVRHYSFPNCLNTELFAYRSLPRVSEPIVAWIGRIEKNKNWRAFLRMARVWADHHSNLKIWMFAAPHAHEPAEFAAFERTLAAYAFGPRLVRHSSMQRADMADMLSIIGDSGGFLCSTSITEGFGYALVEAMSCRCPVLTSESDGPGSFVFHNDTGKIYELDKEDEGIRYGLEYLTNAAQREKIRRQAQRYVRQHFSPDVYAERFLKMLEDLGVR